MKKLLLSVSGGRSSCYMAVHCMTSDKYKDYEKVMVFANTGLEHYETILFLKNLENFLSTKIFVVEAVFSDVKGVGVRHKIVSWDDLSMDGQPLYEAIKNRNNAGSYGVYNTGAPYCSSMTKERVIHSFAKEYFGTTKYISAIGFRREDMPLRVVPIQVKQMIDRKIYPLLSDFDPPIGLNELDNIWSDLPFQLGINSRYGNCQLCFKKSDLNLIETIQQNPSVIEWYNKMEKDFNGNFFRGRKTVMDLLELSKTRRTAFLSDEGESCMCG